MRHAKNALLQFFSTHTSRRILKSRLEPKWIIGLTLIFGFALLPWQGISVAAADHRQEVQSPSILFVENVGQFEDDVLFRAQTEQGTLFVSRTGLWLTTVKMPEELINPAIDAPPGYEPEYIYQGSNLRLTFQGSNPEAQISPFGSISSSFSYLQGPDQANWVLEAPVWSGIRYENLYPGLDLEITGAEGLWSWQFIEHQADEPEAAAPEAFGLLQAPPPIELQIEGADGLDLEENAIRTQTSIGDLELPLIAVDKAGANELIAPDRSPTVREDSIQDPFLASEEDPSANPTPTDSSLVPSTNGLLASLSASTLTKLTGLPTSQAVPEGLEFATYFSGIDGGNWAYAVDVDASGSAYFGGFALTITLPTTPGAFQTSAQGQADGFIVKLSPDGSSLEYATYIAGSEDDDIRGLAVDEQGAVFATGRTVSSDFPVTAGAFDTTPNTPDSFALKLNPTGSDLVFSTFIGSPHGDEGHDIAIDQAGSAYIVGLTDSRDFPTTSGAFQEVFGEGFFDGFIVKVSPDGSSLEYASYIGGSSTDCEVGGLEMECGIAVDAEGNAYIGGPTHSSDFPVTTGAFDTSYNGERDAFIAKISADGSTLIYSTYVGGSSDECRRDCDIAIDQFGAAYLTGSTRSADFPLFGARATQGLAGEWDAFAFKLSPDGDRALYSSLIGGSVTDEIFAGAVTPGGEFFIIGETMSTDYPTTATGAGTCASCDHSPDTILSLIGPDGGLQYSTYLGGDDDDSGYAITVDEAGRAYVTGRTLSTDFPTTAGAYQLNRQGGDNTFLAIIAPTVAAPPTVDLANSYVEVDLASIPADGDSSAAVTVALLDMQGDPIPSWPIEVLASGEEITFEPSAQVSTDADGIATVELRSTVVQESLISVRDLETGALLFDTANVEFVPGPTDPAVSTFTSDTSIVTADGIDSAILTVTFMDALGHPIQGHEVVFFVESGTGVDIDVPDYISDENGQVQATVRSAQAQQVRLQAGDLTDEVTINDEVVIDFVLTDPDLSSASVSPAAVTADGASEATLTVTLINHSGAPVADHAVGLRVDPPHDVLINGQPAGDAVNPLGTSDENGQLTATLQSTDAGIKTLTISDEAVDVVLSDQPQVEFTAGAPDPTNSSVRSAGIAPADGTTEVEIVITVRDALHNRVPGAEVSLVASGNAILTQPTELTNANGQTRGSVANATVETVTVRGAAIKDPYPGILINEETQIRFRGADLMVAKSGLALSNYDGDSTEYALSGGSIDYTLHVTNEGLLPATDISLTDQLPSGLTFIEVISGPDPAVNGNEIGWALGDLAVDDSIEVSFRADIDDSVLGSITNQANVVNGGQEDDTADNSASLVTTVEVPRPVMQLTPPGPTLRVQQGESASLVATLRNSGAGDMNDIAVTLPDSIPWLSLDSLPPASLAPRTEGEFTVTASPPADTTPGTYRDFIIATDSYGNEERIALIVEISAPRRDLQLTVQNDQGEQVANAQVQLIRQQQSVVVTEGVVQTYHENVSGRTNSSGQINFAALQIGDYDYTLVATDHNTATGEFNLSTGDGAHTETLTMTARARLAVSPASPVIGVVRGGTASRQITVTNAGRAPMTGLNLSTPSAVPFVSLAAPSPLPDLAPGESLDFALLASPDLDQSGDIFQDFVTVQADGGQTAQVAFTIELANEASRDLQVNLVDEFDDPVSGGGDVVLVQQELTTLQLPGGETRTFNQQFNANVSGGTAAFAGLEPGAYNYFASPEGYTQETGEILVQAGTDLQEETVRTQFDPFTYTWTVEPLEVGYEITLTMTYDVTTAPPTLLVPEVCWQPGTEPTSETLYLYNPSPLPMTIEDLAVSLPGAHVNLGSLPDQIGIDRLLSLPVEVTKTGPLGVGTVTADYSYQVAAEKYVTFTFNPSSKTSPLIPVGSFLESQYAIEPGVFDPAVEYSLTITQPTDLDWITLTPDPADPMTWDDDTVINILMRVDPPELLAEGIYEDQAPIRVEGSDGTWREGTLQIEATRTAFGTTLHTTFELGEIPTETRQRTSTAVLRTRDCTRWTWSRIAGTTVRRLVGSASGGSFSFPSRGSSPPVQFDHQQVRVELSQKIMLEGEGFKANLELTNTSGAPIEDISVDVILRDENGIDRSAGFDLIPDTPTSVGSIPVGGSGAQEWFILPSALGVTSPEGEHFRASAEITYTWGGNTFTIETVPENITVYPAPDLVITYQLPLTDSVCTEFPLKVTIQNRGQGPARNLRFSTAVPKVVDPATGSALSFTITKTTLNGEPHGNDLELEVGDIPPDPDQPAVIVWTLKSSLPGRFIEFTSDFRQINYLNLPIKPLISEVRTFLVPGPCGEVPTEAVVCPSGECPGISLQGTQDYVGGPINTRTGSVSMQATDFSFPTASGPLTFERWYASETTGIFTETLGHGWTHSLDSRLYFPDHPLGKEGSVMLKLHSANRFEFFITGENEYSAYPGLCGRLERQDGTSVTYTFTDDAQNVYTFDENGRILTLADPQGRTLHYMYDADERLARVEDDSGLRWLEFTYNAEGLLSMVSDHGGRMVTYAYDANGDLVSAVDLAGQTWTYEYSDHNMTVARDPEGGVIERNEYDSQGRALRQFNGEGELVVELTYNSDGTTTVTDSLGRQRTMVYDERGALAERIDPASNSQTKSYDSNFRPSELTDPKGNSTRLTWSETGGNLTRLVDAQGNSIDLEYDTLNNLTSLVDAEGQQTSLTYDGTLLTQSTDPQGNVTTYAYTDASDAPAPEGLINSVTDALGNTTTYQYNELGQRTAMTDALGNTTSFAYDDFGRLIQTADPLGRVTRNEFDGLGRLTRTIRNYDPARPGNDQGQYNVTTEYEYDGRGNMITVTDTFGRTTEFQYDEANRQIAVTDPLGNTTQMAYDDAGNLVQATDPLGRVTQYNYDDLNRLVETIDPLGNSTTRTYDANGNLVTITDALGNTTTFKYDSLNRQVAVIDSLGNRQEMSYNANGNLASQTDAAGRTTAFEYDELNRLVRQTDPAGGVTTHTYDAIGNRVSTTNPKGSTTTFEYDGLNRLARSIDALGGVTQYEYDEIGNRLAVIDANGHRTEYSYDGLNRLIETQNPLGHTFASQYDALGNLLARVDPLGGRTEYQYDALNRLTAQINPMGGTTSYSYDAVGNQLSVTNALGSTTQTEYDALNRAVATIDPNGDRSSTSYDAVGNVAAVTDPLGAVTQFDYDARYRQISMTDPLGRATEYSYDAVGNRVAMTDANGVVTGFEFDSLNRLASVVENKRPALTPDNQTNVRTEYSYDAVGNRLAILDANGHRTDFAYDALNRLLGETDPLGNTTQYAYDAVGNRIAMTDAEGFTTNYQYDAANRLTLIDYPDPDSDVAFSYDAAGNRTEMQDGVGDTSWSYDPLYRPTEITDPFGQTVGYQYDAVGNRLELRYPDGEVVSYGYDPENQLTQVEDWNGQTVSYQYDDVGRLLQAELPNGVVSSYDYDPAGQLQALEHQRSGDLLSSFNYSYDAVGNRVQAVEVMNWPGQPQPVSMTVPAAPVAQEESSQSIPADPLTVALAPFALLILAPVMRRTKPDVPTVLIFLVLVAGAGLALTACGPIPTQTPTPTPTPAPEPSGLQGAIDEAQQLLDQLIADDQIERVPAIRLERRLALADRFLRLGLEDRAAQQLEGFVSIVERYRGDGISQEAADQLVEEVEPIIEALERQRLTPTVTCVQPTGTGYSAHFGYINDNAETVEIEVGALNRFQPAPEDRGQPTTFEPGTFEDIFTVTFEGSALTWQLDGNEATASAASPICEVTTPTVTPSPSPSPSPTATFTPTPPPQQTTTTTIDYAYDPLYRLVEASYDDGQFFRYGYDAVGNRLVEQSDDGDTNYSYDAANRLIEVDGVAYQWDAKGNLLSDGESTFSYDHANRMTAVSDQQSAYSFAYNGLGDRLQQTVDGVSTNYALDISGGLTQVLAAKDTQYLYGIGRIGQIGAGGTQYHLGDALGSVRQVTAAGPAVRFAQSFEPFGDPLLAAGQDPTAYGFTGEWTDATGLVHLRARYYDPSVGRFFQPDPWEGTSNRPDTLHIYSYLGSNPINQTDPSGRCYPPLQWLRNVPPDDVLCEYMDMAAFIWGAPMASPSEKALAATYIGGWVIAHALLVVGAGILAFETVLAPAWQLATTTFAWATSGGSIGTIAQGITYSAATSNLASNLAIASEIYLLYDSLVCGNLDAIGILSSGYFLTNSSPLISRLSRIFSRPHIPDFEFHVGSFTPEEEATVTRVIQETGLDYSGVTFWRGEGAPSGYIASGGPDGITLYDDFFTVGPARQAAIIAEEWFHVQQNLTAISSGLVEMSEGIAKAFGELFK